MNYCPSAIKLDIINTFLYLCLIFFHFEMQSSTSPYLIWIKKKMLKPLYRFCILNHCLYPHFFDVAVTKLSNLIANFSEMLSNFFTKLFLWCSYQSFLQNIQLCFKNYPTLLLLDNYGMIQEIMLTIILCQYTFGGFAKKLKLTLRTHNI